VGNFLAATSLRNAPVPSLVREIESWFDDRFIVCTPADEGTRFSNMDQLKVYEPVNGWTTVLWPMFFGERHVDMARHLSERLHTAVSSVDVYHSETWQHVVYDAGELVDEYGTDPSYLTSMLDDRKTVARRWKGDPEAVARHLGGSAREVARVYRRNRRRRNFDDWDFVTMWEEFGIVYPVGRVPVAVTIVLPERWEQLA
jgi:hypothetical protein